MAPLWLRGRAVGILLASRGRRTSSPRSPARPRPAIELANGYTDVFDGVRRRKDMNPAGEIQQSLLPPRIARAERPAHRGGVLPSYDTGRRLVRYVENRDGVWIAVADAAGRGPRAAAMGSIALAALRASRRNELSLEERRAVHARDDVRRRDEDFFLTALVARWSPVYASFSWVTPGHPPPLLLRADHSVEELRAEVMLPLGLGEREPDVPPQLPHAGGRRPRRPLHRRRLQPPGRATASSASRASPRRRSRRRGLGRARSPSRSRSTSSPLGARPARDAAVVVLAPSRV
jgi:hypothetical protein